MIICKLAILKALPDTEITQNTQNKFDDVVMYYDASWYRIESNR